MPFQFVDSKSYIVNRKKKNVPDEPRPADEVEDRKLCLLTINYQPAFTLVELLIVIAILGVLSSFSVLALVGHQKKARDSQRKNDLQQVKRALEAVKADCKNAAFYTQITGATDEKVRYANLSVYLTTNALKYMQTPLNDPKNDTTYYYGYAQSIVTSVMVCAGTTGSQTRQGVEHFVLRAKLENTNDPDTDKSYNACSTAINTDVGAANFDGAIAPTAGNGYYFACSN